MVGLLSGCFVFLSDLLRHFLVPYEVDFMVVSSYGSGTSSSGSIKLKKDMSIDPKGRDVLIIEDLIDTGTTLEWIVSHLKTKGCESVRLCCLLNKASRRTAKVHVDYVGFECPDEFVVGYGMDFADQVREQTGGAHARREGAGETSGVALGLTPLLCSFSIALRLSACV